MSYIELPTALAAKIADRQVLTDFPAQVNRSLWTGRAKILLLAGSEVWRFRLVFRPLRTESELREARAFFYALRGIANTFEFPFLPTAQQGVATTVASGGAAGATSFVVADASDLLPGMPISVSLPSFHKRLLIITDVTGSTVTFSPALTESAAGGIVEIANPVCHVRLSDPSFRYDDAQGLGGFAVDVEEAVGEPGQGPPYAAYALALKFISAEYWAGSISYALSGFPGYTNTRSGAKGEVNALTGTDRIDDFAANVPGVVSGIGYWSRQSLTNLALQSQTLENAAWSPFQCTITSNATTAPDATATAEFIVPGIENSGTHGIYRLGEPVVNATVYTYSIFAKAGGYDAVQIVAHDAVDSWAATFNLTTGVVIGTGANATSYIQSVGNGWYRCVVVVTANDTTADVRYYVGPSASVTGSGFNSFIGNTTSGVYLWQPQIMAGNLPDGGPIITTTTATVTVGADDLRVNDAAASGDQLIWARADLTNASAVGIKNIATLHGATNAERIHLRKNGTSLEAVVVSASAIVYSASAVDTGNVSIVLRRSGGNWRGGYVKAGVLTWFGADTAAAFPSGLATIHAGHYAAAEHANTAARGIYRKLGAFPTDASVRAAVAETD